MQANKQRLRCQMLTILKVSRGYCPTQQLAIRVKVFLEFKVWMVPAGESCRYAFKGEVWRKWKGVDNEETGLLSQMAYSNFDSEDPIKKLLNSEHYNIE